MPNKGGTQYPHLSEQQRKQLTTRRRRQDDYEKIDHRPIRRGLLALILREEGHTADEALALALEKYPDGSRA